MTIESNPERKNVPSIYYENKRLYYNVSKDGWVDSWGRKKGPKATRYRSISADNGLAQVKVTYEFPDKGFAVNLERIIDKDYVSLDVSRIDYNITDSSGECLNVVGAYYDQTGEIAIASLEFSCFNSEAEKTYPVPYCVYDFEDGILEIYEIPDNDSEGLATLIEYGSKNTFRLDDLRFHYEGIKDDEKLAMFTMQRNASKVEAHVPICLWENAGDDLFDDTEFLWARNMRFLENKIRLNKEQ